MLLQRLDASPIKEGLRQCVEGCDGRHVQVSLCDACRFVCLLGEQFAVISTTVRRRLVWKEGTS